MNEIVEFSHLGHVLPQDIWDFLVEETALTYREGEDGRPVPARVHVEWTITDMQGNEYRAARDMTVEESREISRQLMPILRGRLKK